MTPLDRIITAAKQNPEGLLLLGAGIALILRQTTKGSRPSDQGSRNARKKSRSTAGNSVRSTAESVSEYVADAKEKASEYGEAAVNEASRAFKATRKSVGNFAEDQPIGIEMGGLASGILLAAAQRIWLRTRRTGLKMLRRRRVKALRRPRKRAYAKRLNSFVGIHSHE